MRLDLYLSENGYTESRQAAKNLITGGSVTVDGKIITKPAYDITEEQISIKKDECKYVGRGAYKLEGALDKFGIDVSGMTAIDIGASTGGFTDCLLQRGAVKVYAVDSGINQLHPKLRSDGRVISLEKYNARALDIKDIGELCDIAVMDVSFISQTYIIPKISAILKQDGIFIGLIKPQFEAGRENIGKGGIVKNRDVHFDVCKKIIECAEENGLYFGGLAVSSILGGDGNREYLGYFVKNIADRTEIDDLKIKKTVFDKEKAL